jgi:hypothetical protein
MLELVAELGEDPDRGVARGVSHAADGVAVVPGEIFFSCSMSSGTPLPATMRSMMRCIHPMPSRHGVHCPQDSWW